MLQNFAQRAVMAMENVRLLTETREALEQQTGTAKVLQIINSSPGDVAPVFDAMLETAVGLCEADLGVLRTFEGEAFPLVAICGRDRHIVEQLKQLTPNRFFGLLNPIVRGERVAHVREMGATPIDYQREDFTRVLPGGFDAIFDGIGQDGYSRSFAALKCGGILCIYG